MKVWRILVVGHSISSDFEEDAYSWEDDVDDLRRACLVGGLLVLLIVEEKVAEVAECRWWRFVVEENARQLDLLVLVKAAHESIMDENAMMDRISVGLLRMLVLQSN